MNVVRQIEKLQAQFKESDQAFYELEQRVCRIETAINVLVGQWSKEVSTE